VGARTEVLVATRFFDIPGVGAPEPALIGKPYWQTMNKPAESTPIRLTQLSHGGG
jgi:hypothetical protein